METNKKNISEEIIEGNKLIAEFMGYNLIIPSMRRYPNNWKTSYWERNYDIEKHTTDHVLCEENGLKYHFSWAWLMPVVEKIEDDCKAHVCIYNKSCWIELYGAHNDPCKFERTNNGFILNVYLSVVEFIKWNNLN